MLRQQTEEVPTLPTASARITPEELTQALASIEARQEAEARRLAGTIPIDQAVSELHLDSTSDEIWAEVQAQRAKEIASQRERAQQEQAAQEAREGRRAARQEQASQQQSVAPRTRGRRGWVRLLLPAVALWALVQNGTITLPHLGHHSVPAAAPALLSLAQAPSGKEVYADDSALAQISAGKPAAQITISDSPIGNRWTMVKMGPHVYLRGYIARTDSLQPLQGNALHIYNDADSGELKGQLTSNITLRVDKTPLQKSGGDDDFSEVIVPDFQPDPLTTLSPWH